MITEEHCRSYLRFVRRDGKLILQQKWWITTYEEESHIDAGWPESQRVEWRDIPIEEQP